jgi:hypothetical protein
VSACPGWSAITTASAALWIAARAPFARVAILPARCYVADEWTLTVALHRALYERPLVVDDIVTLAMTIPELVIDEHCLMTHSVDAGTTGSITVSLLDSQSGARREFPPSGNSSHRTSISVAPALSQRCSIRTGQRLLTHSCAHWLIRSMAAAKDGSREICYRTHCARRRGYSGTARRGMRRKYSE